MIVTSINSAVTAVGRSRVLYVTHASPVPAKIGPARRHFHILSQLARFFDVHLLSLGSPVESAACAREFEHRVNAFTYASRQGPAAAKVLRKLARTLSGQCDFLPVREPGLRRDCLEVTARHQFSGIVLSSVLLRGLPLPDGIPIVADTHNVEFDVVRRTAGSADRFLMRCYAATQWRATRRAEERYAKAVDLLLATSSRDRAMFEAEFGVRNVAVIPNGIDLGEFTPAAADPEPGTIVFTGLMSYFPNQQAVRWFLDAVFPSISRAVPGARLIVVGAAPPAWLTRRANERVEISGRVADVRPYLARATVVIAPLLIAGGTRVKILEAQALGRPVVSTTIGAEGLELRHGQSVLLADDAASFAARVIDVLTNQRLAAQIARGGREHVVQHFNWDNIGDTLGTLLGQLLCGSSDVASRLPPLVKAREHRGD
jgi:glycosyltransferase involved in cell wall biosynthesis